MNIKIKNNPRGKSDSEILTKIIEYYLNELLGEDNKFGKLVISFKKLRSGVGGNAKTKHKSGVKLFLIDLDKYASKKEIYRILAHECTHIKQYFLNELTTRHEIVLTARGLINKKVRNWKGTEIRRSIYKKRPWEKEARRHEKLACNILNKIDAPYNVITKPSAIFSGIDFNTPKNNTRKLVISILNGGSIPNGDLVPRVLGGDKDKQKTLKVLREIFALKESGVIQEYNEGSLIYVRAV